MRNRTEINFENGEPSFVRAPREFSKTSGIAQARDSNNLFPTAFDEQTGGIKSTPVQERTDTPLKIVFIARIAAQSHEKTASACRRLTAALSARGHRLLILDREQKRKYEPPICGRTVFYRSVKELKERLGPAIRNADFVLISSNVAEGADIGDWVTQIAQGATAFYDLNTPATLAKIEQGESEHLSRSLIQRYHLYLSFTGGPLLELIRKYYGSTMVRPLYGSVDTSLFYPERAKKKWDLGYAGNFDEDRSPGIDELLLEPARNWVGGRFVVAGHGFLQTSDWPTNVKHVTGLALRKERAFYNAQRFTLNVTGAEMIEAGFSPNLQVFEAAACGTPIISDYWEDLESFFAADEEILFARSGDEALDYLRSIGEQERLRIGNNARRRVLTEHTSQRRALELESFARELLLT
jgi:spore maturation protein CgeB